MAIQTTGSLVNTLNNYNAKEWTDGVRLDAESKLKFSDTPMPGVTNEESKMSFGDLLTKSLAEVNGLQVEANTAIEKLVSGKSKNIEETMIAVEKADIAFKAMNQIRKKVIDAYTEIMRMQV
ncbi:MAG: flagellar hook-basal body complex protein FliE [Bacteriovoracaceae bacterium]